MRAAVESYQSPTHSSQSSMMRDYNVIMNGLDYVDENAIITQLAEDNFTNRMAALEQLRNELRTNGRLPVRNAIGLFQGIDCTLTDCNKDVRRQCLFFIIESMPCLKRDIDACLNVVIARIVSNIGDPRIVVRKVAFQTVRAYMKHTSDMPSLLRNYIQYGIEHNDARVRKETTVLLPVMITEEFAKEDFSELVTSLCKKLVDNNEEETLQQSALQTLKKLCSQTGDARFRSYLLKLQPQLRDYYCRMADFHMEAQPPSPASHYLPEPAPQVASQSQELYYGFIPAATCAQLSDDNFRNRSQAVEQLKTLMENLPSISPLLPYVKEFLGMLNSLLDDNNFKIITVTLDIMAVLVEKMSRDMQPHLEVLIQALTKRMGDNKNVIRQAITKVIIQLMQTLRPKIVLLLLCNNLSHRSPRVRAEAINCVINALLTFPSYEFDLPALCSSMSYCLLDMKRVVRHAALECIAVLAQCLGAGKLQPLFSAVDSLEKKYGGESEGLTVAVQARLSRRTLPRKNEDSLIEYAVQLPSLNSSRNGSLGVQGADVDWILAVSGGGGNSARSMRLEDLESTSRQSSASIDGRRHLSSGKKSKLPWEDSQGAKGGESPIKPKATWTDDKTPEVVRKPSKHGKQRDDLLLASMSYNGSPEASNIESPDVEQPTTKPPFSKSSKSKQEGVTPRASKQGQKEAADSGVAASKSFGGKPMLNPLPAREGSPSALLANTWGYDSISSSTKDLSSSNIPVKASTIPRKNNTSKPAKVPPIPKSHSPVNVDDEIPVDNNANELPQLNASLSKIRSSATKKKADKLFERLEKQQSEIKVINSPSTDSPPAESLADNPFEARPKLARYGSQSKSRSSTETGEKIAGVQAVSQSKLNEGRLAKSESLVLKIRQTTSKSLSGSQSASAGVDEEMVAVVGRGYSDDTLTTPPKAPPKAKRRAPKANTGTAGSSLSPLGLAASSAPGMIPITDDDADLVTIIGKGMFDGDSGRGKSERSNSISLRSDRSNSLSKSSSLRDNSSQQADVESDEDMEGLQMSRGLREVAAKKKRERQEESEARRRAQREREEAFRAADEEQRRLEQEEAAERRLKQQQEAAERRRRQQEAAEKRRKEAELSRKEVLNNEESGLQIAGSSPMKTHSSLSQAQASSLVSLANSPTPSSVSTVEEPRPFSKPAVALKDAMRLIEDDDWSVKMDAINKLRRLAMFHADVIAPSSHSITLALLAEVRNLRSQVAKQAVIGLGDLFVSLKKMLDPELDGCAKTLLPKNGEANDFIRAELDRTLDVMVNNTTPQRCLIAFIVGGASHKNPMVRKLAVKHITTLCEKLGPGKLLSGVKDLTEKVVPVVATMCSDSSPETRWYARKILLLLLKHEDFDAVFNKNLSQKDYRDVKQIADTLKEKGLGEMPSNTPSASGTRRSGTFNRGSRNNSAESSNSISNSMKRKSVGPQAVEDAAPLLEAMSSANWSARNQSIDELMSMLVAKPKVIGALSVKIFDRYALLLKDSNSKVAMHALDALVENDFANLRLIKQHITQSSINLMVQNTAAGLASKNRALQSRASELLDAFINIIDHTTLYQIFIQVAINATLKTKPDIIDRVTYLSKKVYKVTPKSVVLHALPLAWNLVKSLATTGATSVLRDAVTDFISELHKLFGDALFDYAASSPGSRPEFVQKVRELSGVDGRGKGS